MQKTGSSNKNAIPEVWFYYLIINCAFLLPATVFALFPQIFSPIVNFLGVVFAGYWTLVIFYSLLGVPYLYCVVSLGFLIFCISKLDEAVTQKRLCQIFILTAISIALNIYWLINVISFIP